MTCKVIGAAVLAMVFAASPASSQNSMIGRLSGRVMEDGRPIRRLVEVRLESSTSGVIDTAYTIGSEEFEFRAVPINTMERHFLVIEEIGYSEVRYELRVGRDPFGIGAIADFGVIFLYLESLPPEDDGLGLGDTVDLRQLGALIPDEAREAYQAGLEELDQGDSAAGLESLELSVELAPEFYDALIKLGVEYLNLTRYSDAKQMLGRAYDLNENDSILLTNLGSLHFQEGQALERSALTDENLDTAMTSFALAVDFLRAAARLDPASARVNYYLGSAEYKTGSLDEAEESLFLSLEKSPSMDAARLTLINVYVRQQRHEAALEQITLYLEANPDTPERESMEQARSAIEREIDRTMGRVRNR
jgi:Tfp pilus assembly protein PilF